jgi:uncharacterized protein YkwD
MMSYFSLTSIVRYFVVVCLSVAGLIWLGSGVWAAAEPDPGEPESGAAYQLYLPVITKPLLPPVVMQFEADVAVANPGDMVSLMWQTAHADEVTLYQLRPTGEFGGYWSVAAAGVMTHTIALTARNESRFVLTAVNGAEIMVQADVTIHLTCPDSWFFVPAPDICPAEPALVSQAAEQQFEQGTMLWVAETGLIYVLYADGQQPQWQVFVDEWQAGDPIDDPGLVPPPGLYQPQRGFGLVWREQPQVQDRLGWAVAAEEGYETAVQATSYPLYNQLYLLAADDQVWRLGPEGGEWEKINPIGAAQAIADLINQTRAQHGLPPYQVDMRLNQAARRHNLDMAHNHFTGHTGSDGSTPLQRMGEAGYVWQFGGEIIGWGFSGSHNAMFNWWLNSDIHRQMILSPHYEDFGLSYVALPGSDWGTYWTVKMAKPAATNGDQTALARCIAGELIGKNGGGSVWSCSE